MNAPLSPKTLGKRATVETTVFQSGNGQAVRIPKEFQFNTKHVEIRREGQALVLRPVAMTAAEALADLPVMSQHEADEFDEAMASLDDLPPLDEPDGEGLFTPGSARRTAGKTTHRDTRKGRK